MIKPNISSSFSIEMLTKPVKIIATLAAVAITIIIIVVVIVFTTSGTNDIEEQGTELYIRCAHLEKFRKNMDIC